MKKIIYKNILASLFLFVILFAPSLVQAQFTQPCSGTALECMQENAGRANSQIGLTDNNTPIQAVIVNIIRVALGALGVVFMILIMYGGFTWMTSAGNQEGISKAKRILTNSTIGLLIVIISYAVSSWIFSVVLESANDPSIQSDINIWNG